MIIIIVSLLAFSLSLHSMEEKKVPPAYRFIQAQYLPPNPDEESDKEYWNPIQINGRDFYYGETHLLPICNNRLHITWQRSNSPKGSDYQQTVLNSIALTHIIESERNNISIDPIYVTGLREMKINVNDRKTIDRFSKEIPQKITWIPLEITNKVMTDEIPLFNRVPIPFNTKAIIQAPNGHVCIENIQYKFREQYSHSMAFHEKEFIEYYKGVIHEENYLEKIRSPIRRIPTIHSTQEDIVKITSIKGIYLSIFPFGKETSTQSEDTSTQFDKLPNELLYRIAQYYERNSIYTMLVTAQNGKYHFQLTGLRYKSPQEKAMD